MLETKPAPSPGATAGYLMVGCLLLLDAALLFLLASEPLTFFSFLWGAALALSLPAIAFITFWSAALSAVRYILDDDALTIAWGRFSFSLPLTNIQAVLPGAQAPPLRHFRGLRWPGYELGWGTTQREGHEKARYVFATRTEDDQIVVSTTRAACAISPADPVAFRSALEAVAGTAGESGQTGQEEAQLLKEWPAQALWQDRTAQILLLLPLLLNAILFAYLAGTYSRLPAQVPLRIDGDLVTNMGSAARLFLLPGFGLLAWIANSVAGWFFHSQRQEAPVAYLLWGGASVVQIVAWVALFLLLRS